MGRQFPRFPGLLGLALCICAPYSPECRAQAYPGEQSAPVKTDAQGQPLPERPDCPPIAVFYPLALSKVTTCQKNADTEVTMPLSPDASGRAQEKRVRGAFEFQEYLLPEAAQDAAFDNLVRLLPIAGFTIKNSNKPSSITARKGDIWILINVSGEYYNYSVVTEPVEPWKPVKSADEIAQAMKANGHVDIYGIEFAARDQAIQERKSDILLEILKYLKANPDLSIVIESHKISNIGLPEDDSEITRERANAVMDWLVAHGIARSRLQPRACGRDNPIDDNDSSKGAQRNERISLVKSNS